MRPGGADRATALARRRRRAVLHQPGALRDPRPRALRRRAITRPRCSPASPRATATASWSISKSSDFLDAGEMPRQLRGRRRSGRMWSGSKLPRAMVSIRRQRADAGPRLATNEARAHPRLGVRSRQHALPGDSTLYDADRRADDRAISHAHRRSMTTSALELRERYFHQYGATLVGLMRASWPRCARLPAGRPRRRSFGAAARCRISRA